MLGRDLSIIIVNALLLIVIVCIYIHLSQLIKHDGIQIQLIHKQLKEGMSPYQRWQRNSSIRGENVLMPAGKRKRPADAVILQPVQGTRGTVDLSWAIPDREIVDFSGKLKKGTDIALASKSASEVASDLGVSTVDAVQNGAAALSGVAGLQAPGTAPEPGVEVAVDAKQTGVIESTGTESFRSTNPRVEPMTEFMRGSDGGSILSQITKGTKSLVNGVSNAMA